LIQLGREFVDLQYMGLIVFVNFHDQILHRDAPKSVAQAAPAALSL
jgi:hypothetical protein